MTNHEMIDNLIHAQNCINSVLHEARKGTNVGLEVACRAADAELDQALVLLGYYEG